MVLPPLRLTSGDPVADRRADYAQGLAESGDPAAAAELMAQALELVPHWPAGWFRLGELHLAAGETEAAIRAWEEVRRLDPADKLGASVRIELLRPVPVAETMPSAFIRTLYDQYAPRFEASLVDSLGYRGPEMIRDALLAEGRSQFAHVMDIGCGTGLMGATIRPHAGWLGGCDLSPEMLKRAAEKGVYDALNVQDIAHLAVTDARFDLITSADVFIYVGALERVVSWAASSLNAGGVLAFTVETLPEGLGDFRLMPSCRYAHSEAYLARLLSEAGFAAPRLSPVALRHDRGEVVDGLVVTAVLTEARMRRQNDGEDMATA